MLGQVVPRGGNAGCVLGRQVLAAGQDQPAVRGRLVLGNALPMTVDDREAEHGVDVALLRGSLIPLASLGKVGRADAAPVIEAAQLVLRLGVARLGQDRKSTRLNS